MAVLKAFGGDVVTIGDTHNGLDWPSTTTWGDRITVADPGIPLNLYDPSEWDPWAVWRSQPAVRRVVGFAARQFASVPWKAYKRRSDTDRVRQQNSPVERLFSSPSPHRSGYNLMETLLTDRMLYDRWCLLYVGAHRGTPARLLRVPPKLLEIHSNWLGEGTKIIMKNPVAGEADVDLTDAPMAISWGWSAHAAGGSSLLTTLKENLIETRRSVQWRSEQWAQSPKMTGVLKHPDKFKSNEDRERVLQSWVQWRDSPAGGRAGTPVLEQGLEYEELKGVTSRDAQELEGRKFSDEEVATAFHVPPELLGLREATFSNLIALRQMLFNTVLGPFFTEFGQAFNAELVGTIDAEPKLYLEADRDAAVAGSLLEQAQIYATLTGAPVMTVAEARARMNLPELAGTDKLVVPMNVTEGGQSSPRDSGSQNRKPNTQPEQETP